MSTPEFGATILQALASSSHQVVGVVTQPDRPAGRKNRLTAPPVKLVAEQLGLPVMQVERLRGSEILTKLAEFSREADIFVVAAFGMLLPGAVLEMPRLQCLNVHGSLLPEYRGASPVAQAVLDGRSETGLTIMLMEKGLDTGPMLAKKAVPIANDETQSSLMQKLAEVGAELLLETLPLWAGGQLVAEPQDSSQATLTGIIKKDAGQINWHEPAALIERKTRAYNPWPGVFTNWNDQLLKILRAEVLSQNEVNFDQLQTVIPGQTLLARIDKTGEERLIIATGDGFLAPGELQLAGKKAVNIKDFLQGQKSIIGAQLGGQS